MTLRMSSMALLRALRRKAAPWAVTPCCGLGSPRRMAHQLAPMLRRRAPMGKGAAHSSSASAALDPFSR
ncbi:hypothetical protein HS961_08680 [Comamonas piscis]|uniref:Uncharacterized protein n=1 Tax=Comamonas piscis TaxID=1562974 RepID=A0A7G5EFY4_9BURK|nr:hypothetical protein [Comamonas piscis]QMV72909.1 hypothetical protein HS961_08680 [Comamonas piscis]WSO35689.1 hypothetical protein VUJ63_08705 [Comamonas piscis]